MIIKGIFIGNKQEAYVNTDFSDGINIIFSDDNNRGKTIVIQSIMYCLGNTPTFPGSFEYKNYYHILHIEHNKKIIKICRKDKNIIVINEGKLCEFDDISGFKRYWDKEIEKIPILLKDDVLRITDLELLVQLFFVGQDKKVTYDIVNSGWYKKQDFYELIYSMHKNKDENELLKKDKILNIQNQIKMLEKNKKYILKKNEILKSSDSEIKFLSDYNNKLMLEKKLKEIERIKKNLVSNINKRNRIINKKIKNEILIQELNSLNRTIQVGRVYCLKCGSENIFYKTSKSEFCFDISNKTMRNNILNSISYKIKSYKEEIEEINNTITDCQSKLDEFFKEEDISIDRLLIMVRENLINKQEDNNLIQVEENIEELKEQLKKLKETNINENEVLDDIVRNMNYFYSKVNLNDKLMYGDIFTKKDKIYSGSESTEFHLARMFSIAKVLRHNYPIIIDSFRAEDLSSEREQRVLELYAELKKQVIFTTTLKKEEFKKYKEDDSINPIDFSRHKPNKILSNYYLREFNRELEGIGIKL